MKIFSSMTIEKDGEDYYLSVYDVVNDFLKQENVEYVDCKYLNNSDIGEKILLVYKEKGDE